MFHAANADSGDIYLAKSTDVLPVLKILIVDDEITNRLILEGILVNENYDIVQAENGAEAIEVFDKENPDLVLMDVMMPVMDGYEATTIIKNRFSEKFIPIIFLTAITDEQALAKCINAGGDDFLTKPFVHTILMARIDALVRIQKLHNTITSQKEEIKLHQHRMQREAKMAEALFANIVKSEALQKPYIHYLLSPMSLFNGDMLLAADKPSGGLNILVGDFTGHGMAAATGGLPASNIFYEMTEKGYSIAEIAAELNKKMTSILPTGMFLATCILDFNPVSRTVTIWNGGVPDVLIWSTAEKKITSRVKSSHLPIGIQNETQFDDHVEVINVADGDRCYGFSDGIVEATNPNGDMYGQEQLEEIINGVEPEQIFSIIKEGLNEFVCGTEQTDDVTFIEVVFDEIALGDTDKIKTSGGCKAVVTASNWQYSMSLGADALRYTDPLPVVVQGITEIQGLQGSRQQLYTICAELFSNALEHGLLGLSSIMKATPDGFAEYYHEREKRLLELEAGEIIFEATHSPDGDEGGRLVLRITDTGPGFDYTKKSASLAENGGTCGRGLPLVETLCESITYHGRGNIVEAVYVW